MYSAQGKKKYQNKLLTKSGFTLIELLVVIVTMFIVFSVGMANYRDFQRRKILEGAVNRVKSHLRLAQEMALSGTKPADCVTSNLALLNVTFQKDSTTTYSIQGLCSDGVLHSYGATYSLEPDYIDIVITGPGSVVFNTLGRGVVSDVTFVLSQTSTGEFNNIKITKGGEIN
jgi:type II secretory pathway pseudopilin PulG